jgi:hypothetical protein
MNPKPITWASAVLIAIASCCLAATPQKKEVDLGFTLSTELKHRILRPSHIDGIVQIRTVESHVRSDVNAAGVDEGYVLLAIDLSITGDFKIEGRWHGWMYFARRCANPSWESAIEFRLPRGTEFERLRLLSLDELEDFIEKNKWPNQAPDPTTPSGPGSP